MSIAIKRGASFVRTVNLFESNGTTPVSELAADLQAQLRPPNNGAPIDLVVADVSAGVFTLTYTGDTTIWALGTYQLDIQVDQSGVIRYVPDIEVVVSESQTKDYESYVTAVVGSDPVSVAHGTAFGDLVLPATVTVSLKTIVTETVWTQTLAVTWLEGSYDGNTAGDYELTGNITLDAGVGNPHAYTGTVTVTVSPA